MTSIAIDTNVLILLIVGTTGSSLIDSHTALHNYPKGSFQWLCNVPMMS